MISVELLRHVTRVALAEVGDQGFALAGSGALREHGFVRRPTEDVDLFTTRTDPRRSPPAVTRSPARCGPTGSPSTCSAPPTSSRGWPS